MPDAKKFEHGFNRSTADVILRSSNKVDFKVHKVILAEASSVFESMFALPGNSTSDEDGVTALPVVPMQDTAEVLHALLGVLYPGKGPAITSSPRAGDVLAVADKYAMDGVTKHVKSILERAGFMATWFNILHVYALARRYSFMDLAENAARESLKQPFYPYTLSGLQAMTGADYHELLCYRQACVKLFDDYLPLDYEDYHWEELIENLWGDDYDGLRLQSNKGSDAVLQQLGTCDAGKDHRIWFQLHWKRLKEAFTHQVCGDSLNDPTILDRSVDALDCSECSRRIPMELVEFSQRLGIRLDEDISRIKFERFVGK